MVPEHPVTGNGHHHEARHGHASPARNRRAPWRSWALWAGGAAAIVTLFWLLSGNGRSSLLYLGLLLLCPLMHLFMGHGGHGHGGHGNGGTAARRDEDGPA
ncbi:hypothetical protein caldi_22670 [Caldinitratiruptor microaerophilus]|uniref:DUF2933 domain-containing protein n=1 Tax=Caldinitratiruptor microaerophilus TaxID=671077 RepID=A0AA35CL78_9FIRM|nr:hypothetical protein caldi_22670 [Caldinitratiruptor microaerophilus]